MNKTIEITVSPTGETTIQTKGFAGSECRDASRSIEEILGQRSGERLTAEFYQQSEQREQAQEGACDGPSSPTRPASAATEFGRRNAPLGAASEETRST